MNGTVLNLLASYEAWHLSHYTQPFDGGRVKDKVYVCRVLVAGKWSRDEYGATPELAVRRAIGQDV